MEKKKKKVELKGEQSAPPGAQKRPEKHVYLVGTGPKWETCPFDKETWGIAKLMMMNAIPRRINRIFSMDDLDHLQAVRRGNFTKKEFVDWINTWKNVDGTGIQYISCRTHKEINNSVEFPMKEVVKRFKVPYFSNSIAYMVALALYEGYTHISTFGIAQAGTGEYAMERKCLEFWIGMAIGMGVIFNIRTPSSLLQNDTGYMYGYMRQAHELQKDGRL